MHGRAAEPDTFDTGDSAHNPAIHTLQLPPPPSPRDFHHDSPPHSHTGTAAQMDTPTYLATNPANVDDLFIADSGNHVVSGVACMLHFLLSFIFFSFFFPFLFRTPETMW